MADDKMPINRSLLWILVSILLISGSAFMGWLYFLHIRERRLNDDQYRIAAIIQSTAQADALKTVYLAELLDLSLDRPMNLYQFNVKEAAQTLLQSPLIKEASVKKILPGTLYIHYQMRTPIAYIGDFANTAIDEDGVIFPFHPFFTPKRLPTLYLGLDKEECQWGSSLKTSCALELAFSVLQQFEQLQLTSFQLKQIDVTKAQEDSYGERQVVLVLNEDSKTKRSTQSLLFLRLSCDRYPDDLANFRTLQAFLFEKKEKKLPKTQTQNPQGVVVDLRIPHLAFIKG